ncbi:hypothetical protein N7456_012268 [Penicillium angulare]|uniref:Uncharacterized protein n=1 Tax=Penicillium angulare TaxID=116970 RepID=A0A9W9K1I6_9EURO|nr:hypothetical protein N7456_012268 [Penicillium angulare]
MQFSLLILMSIFGAVATMALPSTIQDTPAPTTCQPFPQDLLSSSTCDDAKSSLDKAERILKTNENIYAAYSTSTNQQCLGRNRQMLAAVKAQKEELCGA